MTTENTKPAEEKGDASPVPTVDVAEFDKWLDNFYKECGREVTLAYTTLNQMQNWAMAIIAASIAATVTITKDMTGPKGEPMFAITTPIFIVAAIAYVFNLRFFVRAILCYINLTRWNKLQNAVVSYKLAQRKPPEGKAMLTAEQLRAQVIDDIRNYYHGWLSTIDRSNQVFSNLKLGFYLILALPLLFMLFGVFSLWSDSVVRGLTVFAFGTTIVEFLDFATSAYFDDLASYQRSKKNKPQSVFPIPGLRKPRRNTYFYMWSANLIVSTIIAYWPRIGTWLGALLHRPG